jgi:tRNA threonylcarbamoyladenosine biosynthesis protein TsaB
MTNRTERAGKGHLLLAIETGSRSCSVAVSAGPGDIRALAHEDTDHGHATLLMPMIEAARRKAGCAYSDFARIAVAVGPGSFTGLRVGIAAAQGLGLAAGLPVVGISSFLAVAAGAVRERPGQRVFALLDSRRDEPFLAEVDAQLRLARPAAVVSLSELDIILAAARPLILAGDAPAMERYAQQDGIRLAKRSPTALRIAGLAADPERRYDLPPQPVYVRPPDVTMPKRA